jgi:hypothetical protein
MKTNPVIGSLAARDKIRVLTVEFRAAIVMKKPITKTAIRISITVVYE